MIGSPAFADFFSSAINPALVLLILEEPLLDQHDRRERWYIFWIRSAAAIGIVVVLAKMGKHYEVWNGHPMFPSGHAALASAASACLVLHRGRRWLWIAIPVVLAMAASLVRGGWHTVTEVCGGVALAAVITLACFKIRPPSSRQINPS